jgi:hypothetical protein
MPVNIPLEGALAQVETAYHAGGFYDAMDRINQLVSEPLQSDEKATKDKFYWSQAKLLPRILLFCSNAKLNGEIIFKTDEHIAATSGGACAGFSGLFLQCAAISDLKRDKVQAGDPSHIEQVHDLVWFCKCIALLHYEWEVLNKEQINNVTLFICTLLHLHNRNHSYDIINQYEDDKLINPRLDDTLYQYRNFVEFELTGLQKIVVQDKSICFTLENIEPLAQLLSASQERLYLNIMMFFNTDNTRAGHGIALHKMQSNKILMWDSACGIYQATLRDDEPLIVKMRKVLAIFIAETKKNHAERQIIEFQVDIGLLREQPRPAARSRLTV